MKILVIGGMHGNERLGVDLVASLQENPITGVDALIANPSAVEQNTRYIESDLNRSFGDQPNDTLERRLAKTITKRINEYDVVLDFHNTQTSDNNCCFVGVDADRILYDTALNLGFDDCIQATYDCINKYAANVISIEISIGDEWDSVAYWRESIEKMVIGAANTTSKVLSVYRYSRRVTWQEKNEYTLADWTPFQKVSRRDATLLDATYGAVPIFVGSKLTEYYATLLDPVDTKQLKLANNR